MSVMRLERNAKENLALILLSESDWRVRAVERIDLTSASWTDRTKSIQAAALRAWLEISHLYSHAQVYLPIATFPNGLLLDFNVRVAEGPAFLLQRSHHSDLRTKYLELLAGDAGVEVEEDVRAMMSATFGFATAAWHEVRLPEFEKYTPSPTEFAALLHRYLRTTMNQDWIEGVTPEVVANWMTTYTKEITNLAYERSAPSIDSACAHPLLALPNVSQEWLGTQEDAENLLTRFQEFFHAMKDKLSEPDANDAQRTAAKEFLNRYASYGNYWDAFVECTVPLDEPFLIHISEKRGLHFGAPSESTPSAGISPSWALAKSSNQLVVFNDAGSNHVNIRVTDTNVELVGSEFTITDEQGRKMQGFPDFFQSTSELLMFSSTKDDRLKHLWVNIPLKPASTTAVSRWTTVVMTSSALLGFIFLLFHWLSAGGHKTVNAGDVVVILVPTAIAASLLLVRETSTLSAQIGKEWSRATAIFLLLLWLFTLFMFGLNKVEWGTEPERRTRSAESLVVGKVSLWPR